MKFTCEVNIQVDRKRLVELFEDSDNLIHWQDGFQGLEILEGSAGQVGSKTLLKYVSGKNKIEIEESILINDLPESFSGLYISSHTKNTMTHFFEPISSNETLYTAEVDYTWLSFLLRIMTFFKPKMLQSQVQKWMENFKVFAETAR